MFCCIYFCCTFVEYLHVVSPLTATNTHRFKFLDHHFIVWTCERIQLDNAPSKSTRLCFMIRIIQLDPEIGLREDSGSNNEELPTYHAALQTTSFALPPPAYVSLPNTHYQPNV
ncbi:hypothetical protein BY458DRAFT_430876 [Sporodiniella umbellata]|nr:hypothetical protein BY458DRAFT_430876 [Sporodiniella umbellata]